MKINISKDVEKYSEGIVMGLTLTQFIYSFSALGVGAIIALVLYYVIRIEISFCVFISIPFSIPIALGGFYEKNGMNFIELIKRHLNKTKGVLLYQSNESLEALNAEKNANLEKDVNTEMKQIKLLLFTVVGIFIFLMVGVILLKIYLM